MTTSQVILGAAAVALVGTGVLVGNLTSGSPAPATLDAGITTPQPDPTPAAPQPQPRAGMGPIAAGLRLRATADGVTRDTVQRARAGAHIRRLGTLVVVDSTADDAAVNHPVLAALVDAAARHTDLDSNTLYPGSGLVPPGASGALDLTLNGCDARSGSDAAGQLTTAWTACRVYAIVVRCVVADPAGDGTTDVVACDGSTADATSAFAVLDSKHEDINLGVNDAGMPVLAEHFVVHVRNTGSVARRFYADVAYGPALGGGSGSGSGG